MRTLPLVCIEWVDSSTARGWHALKDIDDSLSHCVSVGWLWHDTNDVKVLLANVSLSTDDGTVDMATDAITIPHAAITAMHDLSMPDEAQEITIRG